MIYLNENDLRDIGLDWSQLIDVIEDAVKCLEKEDFAQPLKPYLRYKDLKNRIIAMPAFVGGNINKSGIKWIASFPNNINSGIPRANSVSIINDADTGVPVCIINSTLISAIRTAAVTGLVLNQYVKHRARQEKFEIGIIGYGPIGQLHLEMVMNLIGERVNEVRIFDLRHINTSNINETYQNKVKVVSSWEEAYDEADVFITCTASKSPYIDRKPKLGSVQLNISLRDYMAKTKKYFDQIIVDNWEEVCRENTDIEVMHLNEKLNKVDTISLPEFFVSNKISELNDHEVLMFNPMGMAVFDIAIGNYYYQQALDMELGTVLK